MQDSVHTVMPSLAQTPMPVKYVSNALGRCNFYLSASVSLLRLPEWGWN